MIAVCGAARRVLIGYAVYNGLLAGKRLPYRLIYEIRPV